MQKRQWIALFSSLGLLVLAAVDGQAAQTPRHLHEHNGLRAAFGADIRMQRRTSFDVPLSARPAFSRFLRQNGNRWRAIWDTDTQIPLRIYGAGILFPGVNASAVKAEAAARKVLGQHLDLLAPGAQMDDFILVSNVNEAKIRSLGFVQQFLGKPVRGGQISVRFKNNRLIVFGSEALPRVHLEKKNGRIDKHAAIQLATKWIEDDFGSKTSIHAYEGEIILPLIRAAQQIEYHEAFSIVLNAKNPLARWRVFVDVGNGKVLAREQTLLFASGEVKYNAPERHPGGDRKDWPAAQASMLIDGSVLETDSDGVLTWTGSSSIALRTNVIGPLVRVNNDQGDEVTMDATLSDGGSIVLDRRDSEVEDAQINTFVAVGIAKIKAKSFAPGMSFLNEQFRANVNLEGSCNAFFDGTTISFFSASRRCQNTGRLADVVYHEFGHAVHAHAVIRGVGDFDRSTGEGAADFFAATITGDPGMGRGFFYSDRALRHIDPESEEARWPDDIDEDPHITGLIFAGALWDLRKSLIEKLGEDAGIAHTEGLYYQALRRSSDVPSTYAEVLAADDDDGDLSNGTPNYCEISDAFSRHGLADPQTAGIGFDIPQLDQFNVLVPVSNGIDCPSSKIDHAMLNWELRHDPNIHGQIEMNQSPNGLEAKLPEQAAGTVINFEIVVQLQNGDEIEFPRNPASPLYELFIGEVVELYCTDFELNPEFDGWTHKLLRGNEGSAGADDWHWGVPAGVQGSGDPARAFSGSKVIGNDLGGEINGQSYNGVYQRNISNIMHSPVINTQGYDNVRIQYRRWLNVEDGHFDRASIYANGQEAWHNLDTGDEGDTHHTDMEWRFQDIDISDQLMNEQVQIGFEISSDRGLNMGGWTIDDFCVVAFVVPVCGDGKINSGEACDDGNSVDNDRCNNNCTLNGPDVLCGNGTLDEGEFCDWGISEEGCTKECTMAKAIVPSLDKTSLGRASEAGCGCQIERSQSPWSWSLMFLFGLATLGAVRRRRH